MVRVGIVGAGWVAQARHIPSYRRHADADLVAIFDRAPERAAAAASRHGIPRHHSELSDFLDEDLDIISICTPPWLHAEQAIEALGRGVNVLTEKPMAMNLKEAEAMVEAAATAERLLCVSHNFLFSRAVQKADKLLEGRPPSYVLGVQMSSARRRLPDWYEQLPGGLLLDESPHMLYTLQHFLGPLRLQGARATFSGSSRLPATVDIHVQGESGSGQVTMLFETPLSEWHVGLIGSREVVSLDIFRDIAVRLGSDEAHKPLDILATSARAIAGHAAGVATSGGRYVTRRLFWGHDVVIHRFVEAVLGRGPAPVDPRQSMGVVRLTDEILAELALA